MCNSDIPISEVSVYKLYFTALDVCVLHMDYYEIIYILNFNVSNNGEEIDQSWWRGLTQCGPVEKEMANHFSILALRTT